jgi:sulfopyruvate decarboxylase subunit alpha
MKTSSVDARVRNALGRQGIDLVLTVPCKYFAPLLETIEGDGRFQLLYPSREEEGLGIAAGAYLAGRKSIMLIQNSGWGALANAYCSLNQFYDIPACFLISFRGDELEQVPAQVPLGRITHGLLRLLALEPILLEQPGDSARFECGLREYVRKGKSVAFLAKRTFWTSDEASPGSTRPSQ